MWKDGDRSAEATGLIKDAPAGTTALYNVLFVRASRLTIAQLKTPSDGLLHAFRNAAGMDGGEFPV